MRIYYIRTLLLISIVGLILPTSIFAASLTIVTPQTAVRAGDEVTISLMLNTEGEIINTVGGTITFSPDIMSYQISNEANSIINFWIEQPHEINPGRLTFAGIIPGGYSGENGLLLSLTFKAVRDGQTNISIIDSQILQHDGEGTPLETHVVTASIAVNQENAVTKSQPIIDTDPPEDFTPIITRDQQIFNNDWFLVFATQDKGSGIDRYEIKEGIDFFRTVTSPYHLRFQALDRPIIIKVIDRSGNERIVKIPPRYPQPWYTKEKIIIALLSVCVILGSLTFVLWRRKKYIHT